MHSKSQFSAENAHSESCNGLLRADSPIPSDQVTEDSIVFEVPGSSEDTAQLLSSSDIRNGGVATGNGGMSVVSAAFLITNAALGAGLLNFPLAFHEAGGIVPGNVVHMFFLLATVGSLFIMAMTADRFKSKTYQEMVTDQCGVWAGHFAAACIAVYCFITCITFIIIVGDQTDRFFANFVGPNFCDSWWLRRHFTMFISSLAVLSLSLFRDMDRLVSMGYLGSVFMVYLVVVIVVVWAVGNYQPGEILVFDERELVYMFNVLPTICFGYQCHVSSVPIYHSIRDRSRTKYFMACTLAMLSCAVVYSLAANFGYLTFGSNVADDLLLSYDNEHAGAMAVNLAVVVLALKSITTYPVLMFCVREAVVTFYVTLRGLSSVDAARTEPVRRYVVVLVLWVATVCAALLAESIASVVKLLGSLAAFFIFTLPGFCLFNESNRMADARLMSGAASGSSLNPASRPLHVWSSAQVLLGRVIALFYIALGFFTFGLSVTLATVSAFGSGGGGSASLCIVDSNSSGVTDFQKLYRFSVLPRRDDLHY